MRANKIQVNQRIYVKDFIGDPDKMAGSHFSGSTNYKENDLHFNGVQRLNPGYADIMVSCGGGCTTARQAAIQYLKEMQDITSDPKKTDFYKMAVISSKYPLDDANFLQCVSEGTYTESKRLFPAKPEGVKGKPSLVMLELSQKITDAPSLQAFGVHVLKLEEEVIQRCLSDNKECITEAAASTLRSWLIRQKNGGEEVWDTLWGSLEKEYNNGNIEYSIVEAITNGLGQAVK